MNRLLTIVDTKYQRLEYLESTGTQYIDTGYKFTTEFGEVDMVAQLTQTSSTVSAFCGNIRSAIGRTFLVQQVNSNGIYFQTGVSPLNINSNISDTNKHHIRAITSDKNYLYIDDTLIGNVAKEGTIKNTENFVIFGRKADSSPVSNFAKMKLYSFKLYDDSVLVRNYIPVLRKTDNELGMLDLVEGKFYPNAGTGKFLANGIVGYTVVGSPTITDGVVSGFSSANYLTVSKPSSITTFELNLKFSFSDLSNYQFVFGDNTNNGVQIQKNDDANNTIRLRYGNGSSSNNIDILANPSLNTNYIFNIKVNGTNAIVSYQIEGQQATTNTYTLNFAPIFGTSNWIFGRRVINEGSVGYLKGSIDLGNSYIKIDNKLWFNGQQA